MKLHRLARRMPGGPLRSFRRAMLNATSRRPDPTPIAIRQQLSDLFRPHNQRLCQHLGRALKDWF